MASPFLAGTADVSALTDDFGDFWIDGQERGTHHLVNENACYTARQLGPLVVGKNLNIGGIVLHKVGRP